MAQRRQGGGWRPVKDIYVARTVVDPQPRLEGLTRALGRSLGRVATISVLSGMHLTLLEGSGSVRRAFQRHAFTPSDVRRFSGGLKTHIDHALPGNAHTVDVDPEQPLVWLGGRTRKLAFNIVQSEVLNEERAAIEDFLASHFSQVPKLRPLQPHITLGVVDQRFIRPEQRQDPTLLLPNGLQEPLTISLNGLATYLDTISDQPT